VVFDRLIQAGDLGLTIDYGISRTGSILQRKTNGEWQDFLVDGVPLIYPFDVNQLPPSIGILNAILPATLEY
jgi:hypothetical protein